MDNKLTSPNQFKKNTLIDRSTNQPLLVFGAHGQLARSLQKVFKQNHLKNSIFLASHEADFKNPIVVSKLVRKWNPILVINATGYTEVDRAEKEEEVANLVNAYSPGAIAEVCAELHVPFIHFSTEFVFSERESGSNLPWREDDLPCPINAYGRSKLLGEKQIAAAGGQWIIFRTSWVFDAEGRNFLRTMSRIGVESEIVRVVSDHFGAPTYAPHLAQAVYECLSKLPSYAEFPTGIYNLCSQGETTWFEFACEIFSELRKLGVDLRAQKVLPIANADYVRPARCPSNSRLSLDKAQRIFGVSMPQWRTGLIECLQRMDEQGLLRFGPDR